MAKQPGRTLLLKIGDGELAETFDNLAGVRTKTFTLNNQNYDVTTPSQTTPGGQLWQELMTGVRSFSFSGSGIFEDHTTETRLLEVAHGTGQADTADAIANFQVIVPDLGTFEGAFHVDSLSYQGEMQGGVGYEISLATSGYVDFTAAV